MVAEHHHIRQLSPAHAHALHGLHFRRFTFTATRHVSKASRGVGGGSTRESLVLGNNQLDSVCVLRKNKKLRYTRPTCRVVYECAGGAGSRVRPELHYRDKRKAIPKVFQHTAIWIEFPGGQCPWLSPLHISRNIGKPWVQGVSSF